MVDPRTILLGEVGLGGQVRPVSQLELRLREAAKLGFKRAIIPKGQNPADLGMQIIPVGKVLDAIIASIPSQPATMGSPTPASSSEASSSEVDHSEVPDF